MIGNYEVAVGILLIKQVIDLTKTDPQVLTWAISNQASRANLSPSETKEMIDSAMTTIEEVVKLQAKVRQWEVTGTFVI